MLHILLGLTNFLMSNFFYWIDERAEPKLPDELNAPYVAITADITFDDETIEVNKCEWVVLNLLKLVNF